MAKFLSAPAAASLFLMLTALDAIQELPKKSLLQSASDESHSGDAHREIKHLTASRKLMLGDKMKRVKGDLQPPKDANWFASFDEAESSYDANADNGRAHLDQNNVGMVLGGWNPQLKDPYDQKVVDAEWFDESKSAADKQAWQTHFPALTTGLANHGASPGKWYQNAGGQWQEEYHNAKIMKPDNWMDYMQAQVLPASWFDNAVSQYDGFGRPQSPNIGTGYTLWDWEERSVNTSLKCKDPGCIANVSLQAPFDPSKEVAKYCKLNVYFHATDFDEQYSGERVEWIQVNNNPVSSDCFPKASGCNKTAGSPLYACVNNRDMTHAMTETGYMAIAAKIPEVVDECPYEGNLLSAVAMATCLVTPIKKAAEAETATAKKPVDPELKLACKSETPIKCRTRGCMAETVIPIASFCAPDEKNKCKLSMTVYQTDYDNTSPSVEMIEFINVSGKEEKKELKPGKNPCTAVYDGKEVSDKDRVYEALKDVDISKNATQGFVKVSAKISEFVDECAYEGHLFSGLITVDCGEIKVKESELATATANGTSPMIDATNVTNATLMDMVIETPQERITRQLRVRRQ